MQSSLVGSKARACVASFRRIRTASTTALKSSYFSSSKPKHSFCSYASDPTSLQHGRCTPPPAAVQSQDPRRQPQIFTPEASRFKVFRVIGDGSCMFRSIVQGLNVITKGVAMSPESETTAAFNLRQAVVQELMNRRSEIEPFIPGIVDEGISFEEYLQRMSNPAAWGGEPEMVMAVNVVRHPITVWRLLRGRAEAIVTYGEELAAPHINLLWHEAGHYDLLVVERGPTEGSAGASAAA